METRNNLRKMALLAGAALLSTGAMAVGTVATMEGMQTTSEMVRYNILDAQTPEGAVILYRRLNRAAQKVCGEPYATTHRFPSDTDRSCIAAALDKAVEQVGIPLVTALHQQGHAGAKLAARRTSGSIETVASR